MCLLAPGIAGVGFCRYVRRTSEPARGLHNRRGAGATELLGPRDNWEPEWIGFERAAWRQGRLRRLSAGRDDAGRIGPEISLVYRAVAYLFDMSKKTVQRVFRIVGWQVRKRSVRFRPMCARDNWTTVALVIDTTHGSCLVGT
jgi:hypothetical protein